MKQKALPVNPELISQIRLTQEVSPAGHRFVKATLWVAGMPFCMDVNNSTTLKKIKALAESHGADFLDFSEVKS